MPTSSSPEPVERTFYYFYGHFSYAHIDAFIVANFSLNANGRYISRSTGHILMGFVFKPQKTYFANATQFETTGLSIEAVTMSPSTSLEFGFLAVPSNSVTINFAPGSAISLSAYIVGANAEDTYNLLVNYNQSREFDLAYLDLESYLSFKNVFPLSTGVYFTRAAISMPIVANPVVSNYKNYRTLKFTPFPFPGSGSSAPPGLEDVAYKIGEPCPPTWYDIGVSTASIAEDSLAQPTDRASKQISDPKQTILCGCDLNASDIRKSMIEQGLLENRPTKPLNVWRYILIRLLIWFFIFLSVILVSRAIYVNAKSGAIDEKHITE